MHTLLIVSLASEMGRPNSMGAEGAERATAESKSGRLDAVVGRSPL